jgi:hypothetical protein
VRIGIFAKTFARPSPEGVFDALARRDLRETQFNMSVAGLRRSPRAAWPGRGGGGRQPGLPPGKAARGRFGRSRYGRGGETLMPAFEPSRARRGSIRRDLRTSRHTR